MRKIRLNCQFQTQYLLITNPCPPFFSRNSFVMSDFVLENHRSHPDRKYVFCYLHYAQTKDRGILQTNNIALFENYLRLKFPNIGPSCGSNTYRTKF